jgi:hypothetical protein
MSACRSCEAPIVWARTEHGKRMPLDRSPYAGDDPRGLFVIRHEANRRRGDNFVAVAVPAGAFPDEPVYRSHFSTCPQRDDWRRP